MVAYELSTTLATATNPEIKATKIAADTLHLDCFVQG
jgi:hypothetical protein